jgi:hypothetical protein
MLYILDYGAGNVASLGEPSEPTILRLMGANTSFVPSANSVRSLGVDFEWVKNVEDIEKADVSHPKALSRSQ